MTAEAGYFIIIKMARDIPGRKRMHSMKRYRIISIFLALALALFWLSLAIAVPILARPFYYSQARSLELDKATGCSYDTIFEAYDEVMDYLVYGADFGTGELSWSEDGKAHFEDCRGLFRLDFAVLALSAIFLIVVLPFCRRGELRQRLGHTSFFAALVPTLLLAVAGIWAAISFDGFFTFFHQTLFPGKTNWVFDVSTDPIVLILPYEFWMRAGILIFAVAMAGLWGTAWLMGRNGRRRS